MRYNYYQYTDNVEEAKKITLDKIKSELRNSDDGRQIPMIVHLIRCGIKIQCNEKIFAAVKKY